MKYSFMTSFTSWNWRFACRDFSNDKNQRTAWARDSPNLTVMGHLGSGTTNLPSGVRECADWKWSKTEHSSRVRVLLATVFSATSQNCRSMSSPVRTDTWWEATVLFCTLSPVLPARTQPNAVSKTVGELWDPDHRPWRIASTNVSTPSQVRRQGGAGGAHAPPCFTVIHWNCIVQQQEIFQPLLRVHWRGSRIRR